MKVSASRYHDFSAGHRVHGHESKCAFLHGHNYRIHFDVEAEQLDSVGRVVDFADIKLICEWLEENWDHRFLAWEKDSAMKRLALGYEHFDEGEADARAVLDMSIVWVPFNPTAENMAAHLMVVGQGILDDIQHRLGGAYLKLVRVTIDETRKCSAAVRL